MRTANLAVKFLLELAAFAALAVAGGRLGVGIGAVVLAVVLPLAAVAVWARWNAPRSAHRLPTGPRVVCELAVFGAAAVLLAASGAPVWAIGFSALVALNAVGLTVLHQWEA